MSDPLPPVEGTVAYFDALTAKNGGATEIVGHCRGGPGTDQFDMLTPWWRGSNKAPHPTALLPRARILPRHRRRAAGHFALSARRALSAPRTATLQMRPIMAAWRRNSLTVSGDEVSAPVCRRPRDHVSQIAGRGSNRTIPTEWLGRRPVRLLSVRVQAVTVTENCSCNAV
jgi:hypothetical protein